MLIWFKFIFNVFSRIPVRNLQTFGPKILWLIDFIFLILLLQWLNVGVTKDCCLRLLYIVPIHWLENKIINSENQLWKQDCSSRFLDYGHCQLPGGSDWLNLFSCWVFGLVLTLEWEFCCIYWQTTIA